MHNQINGNLYHLIRQQLKNSICVVSVENLDLYLSDEEYVIPDVMILCDRNKIKNDKYRGIPMFIAETLSPATSFRDKTIKKEKYARLGIDEYWIISPKECSVEVHYLEGEGYKMAASYILVEEKEDQNYNADIVLTLRSMPAISVMLRSIFENID